jgi:endonuclease III related protein
MTSEIAAPTMRTRRDSRRRLHDIYANLRKHFGYQHPWWPGSPLEITLSAILVQRCDWSAAWAGVGRVRKAGLLSLPALASAELPRVHECIRGVSFGRQKAHRLVGLAQGLTARGFTEVEAFLSHRDTAPLREDLLCLKGVGNETADCILCFASDRHPSFVCDSYAKRVFERAGLEPGDWSYAGLKRFVEGHILADLSLYDQFTFASEVPREVALFRDFHAQIVELGRHHCHSKNPSCHARGRRGWRDYDFCDGHCTEEGCSACPLRDECRHARASAPRQGRKARTPVTGRVELATVPCC